MTRDYFIQFLNGDYEQIKNINNYTLTDKLITLYENGNLRFAASMEFVKFVGSKPSDDKGNS